MVKWRNVAEAQQNCASATSGELTSSQLETITLSVRSLHDDDTTAPSMEPTTLDRFGKANSKPQKALLALSDTASAAVYGDVATLTTRMDPKVRK
jgi:hypothetical protein